jgi:hypothetical protein
MAIIGNALYGLALQNYPFPDVLTDNLRAVLVRTGVGPGLYDAQQNTDQFLSDIPVAAQVAFSGLLAGKSWSLGTLGCSDFSFGVVAAGAPCQAIVIFRDTGTPATSNLLAFISAGIGLPVTPDGSSSINVTQNVAGLFSIGV